MEMSRKPPKNNGFLRGLAPPWGGDAIYAGLMASEAGAFSFS